jgi:hypothetical protein
MSHEGVAYKEQTSLIKYKWAQTYTYFSEFILKTPNILWSTKLLTENSLASFQNNKYTSVAATYHSFLSFQSYLIILQPCGLFRINF